MARTRDPAENGPGVRRVVLWWRVRCLWRRRGEPGFGGPPPAPRLGLRFRG